MSMAGHTFMPGEGIVQDGIEATIEAVGRLGRVGMRQTDAEILRLMSNEVER